MRRVNYLRFSFSIVEVNKGFRSGLVPRQQGLCRCILVNLVQQVVFVFTSLWSPSGETVKRSPEDNVRNCSTYWGRSDETEWTVKEMKEGGVRKEEGCEGVTTWEKDEKIKERYKMKTKEIREEGELVT